MFLLEIKCKLHSIMQHSQKGCTFWTLENRDKKNELKKAKAKLLYQLYPNLYLVGTSK